MREMNEYRRALMSDFSITPELHRSQLVLCVYVCVCVCVCYIMALVHFLPTNYRQKHKLKDKNEIRIYLHFEALYVYCALKP